MMTRITRGWGGRWGRFRSFRRCPWRARIFCCCNNCRCRRRWMCAWRRSCPVGSPCRAGRRFPPTNESRTFSPGFYLYGESWRNVTFANFWFWQLRTVTAFWIQTPRRNVPPLHHIIMFYKVNVILKIKLSKNKILQFGLCLCVLSLKILKIRKIYNLKKFFPITIPFKSVIFFLISCAWHIPRPSPLNGTGTVAL